MATDKKFSYNGMGYDTDSPYIGGLEQAKEYIDGKFNEASTEHDQIKCAVKCSAHEVMHNEFHIAKGIHQHIDDAKKEVESDNATQASTIISEVNKHIDLKFSDLNEDVKNSIASKAN